MKNFNAITIISFVPGAFSPAYATSPTKQFSNCLVDTLNGKERKNITK